ncbi:MAG: hypothetical protein VX460_07540 [Planctomycetota bacterium]|nr:hypothetical protein [Planctomycetota bacterium]
MDRLTLHLEGGETAALELTHERLFDAPESEQVPDIGALIPGRRGRGVRFAWVASLAAPGDELAYVTLESDDGRFAATLTRLEMAEAVLVHADGERPFGAADGGPFRLYIPGAADRCGNVKHLGRVGFSSRPGADTRPPEEERAC